MCWLTSWVKKILSSDVKGDEMAYPPTDLITSYFLGGDDLSGPSDPNIDISTKWFSEHGVASTWVESNGLYQNTNTAAAANILQAIATAHRSRNLYYSLTLSAAGHEPEGDAAIVAAMQASYALYVARSMFPGINSSYHFYIELEIGLEWLAYPANYASYLYVYSTIINWIKTQVGAHAIVIFMSPVVVNPLYGVPPATADILTYYLAFLNELGAAIGVGASLKIVSAVQDMCGRGVDFEPPSGSKYLDNLAGVAAHYEACSTTNYGSNIIGKVNPEIFRLVGGSFVNGPWSNILIQIQNAHPYSDSQLGASWAWYQWNSAFLDFKNNYHLYYAGATNIISLTGN